MVYMQDPGEAGTDKEVEKLKNTLQEHASIVEQFINTYKETHGNVRKENRIKKKYCNANKNYLINTSRTFDKGQKSTWWIEKSKYHSIVWEYQIDQ